MKLFYYMFNTLYWSSQYFFKAKMAVGLTKFCPKFYLILDKNIWHSYVFNYNVY